MMQQQPLQMQPMQMQPVMMQQQPMQQQQQMMMMPVMKLQLSAQQNNSPPAAYPNSFQQNTNQFPVVPLHQMGYPTYPAVSSSAPNRTPPVPGQENEFDAERAKWKAAWDEEENKQRWAEWSDLDYER